MLPLALRAGTQYSIAMEKAGDRLEGPSVLPCGFMRLRGAFAGPETMVPLGDHTGMLAGDVPAAWPARTTAGPARPARPHPEQRGAGHGRGCTGGLGLWLAMREPGIGQLYAFGAAVRTGPAAALTRGAGRGPADERARLRHPAAAWRRDGTQRTGPAASFELGACPFGTEGRSSLTASSGMSGTGTLPDAPPWAACGSVRTVRGEPT